MDIIKVDKDFMPSKDTITNEKLFPKVYKKLPVDEILGSISKKTVNKKWHTFLQIFFIVVVLAILIMAGLFLYYVKIGKLTPTFWQNMSFNPVITVNTPIENSYDFNPNINNVYRNNYTIINEINCPEIICNC